MLKRGDTVRVHYTGKYEDGQVFDSTAADEPVMFTIGDEMMLEAFERAVMSMVPGEKKTIHLKAREAYGDYDPELIYTVKKDEVFGDREIAVGSEIQIPYEDSVVSLTVVAVDGNEVKLDGNSEMAGKDVVFDIELIEVLPGAGDGDVSDDLDEFDEFDSFDEFAGGYDDNLL